MTQRHVTDPAEIGQLLRRIVGRWEGAGHGRFPTIDSFDYREIFTANVRLEGEGTVHYEQQTWRVAEGEANDEVLHWESGFLMSRDDGKVELLNAQESRRVEVLVGDLFVDDATSECVLKLESVVQAHDERMVATTREIRFDASSLSYAVAMHTTGVQHIEPHLESTLKRTD